MARAAPARRAAHRRRAAPPRGVGGVGRRHDRRGARPHDLHRARGAQRPARRRPARARRPRGRHGLAADAQPARVRGAGVRDLAARRHLLRHPDGGRRARGGPHAPHAPARRCSSSRPRTAATTTSRWRRKLLGEAPELRHVVVLGGDPPEDEAFVAFERLAESDPLPDDHPGGRAGIAQLGFTSGTTGEPKAVMNTHETLEAVWRNWVEHVGGATRARRSGRQPHRLARRPPHGLPVGGAAERAPRGDVRVPGPLGPGGRRARDAPSSASRR